MVSMEKFNEMTMKGFIALTIISLIVGIIVGLIPNASALEFDNVLISVDIGEKYDGLIIKNAFGFGDDIARMKIVDDGSDCFINCYAIINITLFQNDVLPAQFSAYDKNGKGISKKFNYYYWVKNTWDVVVPHYKTTCVDNQTCTTVNDYNTTEERTSYDWKKYRGEVLPKGSYLFKTESKRNVNEPIDWAFSYKGISASEIKQKWAWWDGSWLAKQKLNVTGSTSNLFNYQIRLTVPYDSDMQSDYDDLRFTNGAEDTEMHYWIENYTSANATVWVEFNSLPANTTTTFYMYYKNSGASTTSNGANTFIQFGDFRIATGSAMPTNWQNGSDMTYNFSTNYGITINPSTDGWDKGHGVFYTGTESAQIPARAIAIDLIRWDNNGHGAFGYTDNPSTSNSVGGYGQVMTSQATNNWMLTKIVNGGAVAGAQGGTATAGVKYFSELRVNTSTTAEMYANNVFIAGGTAQNTSVTYALTSGTYHASALYSIGAMFLTNWTTGTQPTYVFGAEEVPAGEVTIGLSTPSDAFNTSNSTVFFNWTTTPTSTTVKNWTFYIWNSTGVVTSLFNTENSDIAIINSTTQSLFEGSFIWGIYACSNSTGNTCSYSSNRTFRIDLTSPTIVLNYGNGTFNFGSAGINHTINFTATDDYLDKCSISFGSTESFSSLSDGLDHLFDRDLTNFHHLSTGLYSFEISPSLPSMIVIAGNSGSGNKKNNTISFSSCTSYNISLNVSRVDFISPYLYNFSCGAVNLGGISYSTFGAFEVLYSPSEFFDPLWTATIYNVTCSNGTIASYLYNVTNSSNYATIIVNDTVGQTAVYPFSWNYNIFRNSVTYGGAGNVIEGTTTVFNLTLNHTPKTSYDASASLWYNGTNYGYTTKTVTGSDKIYFTKSLVIPDGFGNTTGDPVSWYWSFNTTYTPNENITLQSQNVFSVEVGNCTDYGALILNATIKDEETRTVFDENTSTTIKLDLDILNVDGSSVVAEYNITAINQSSVEVCVPVGLNNGTGLTTDFTIEFSSDDHVTEFYYMDNGSLNTDCKFNSYTSCAVSLFDLASADSTTFLFEFTGADGLTVDDAIVHVFRKYIGTGTSSEVERSRQDNTGQTHMHLVEEDVIYYFVVSQYGTIIFNSSEYNAKCLADPCTIELSAKGGFNPFDTDNDLLDDTSYRIESEKTTRTVTLYFETEEAKDFNMSLYRISDGSIYYVNSSTVSATSGSVVLTVPYVYGNQTFFVALFVDDLFIDSEYVDFREMGNDYFGTTGIILGALMVVALGLMAITEGLAFIVVLIFGLFIVGVMQLIDLAWGALISILTAGGIIIWKMVQRRGQ